MSTVNILEAKTHLSRLVEAVESGREREIIIARNGRPAARLVPLEPRKGGVRLGVAQGQFEVPDDIDEANPLIAQLFGVEEGSDEGGPQE